MRYDSAELRGVRLHPAGFLIVDARPTRAGVFKYRRPDGTVRREYRPPDEVSRLDSISTLRGASVTDLHPTAGTVTPLTVHELEVGTVTDARMDGAYVVAELVVKRADAIELIRQKKRVELSCGYAQKYDPTPGQTPEGEPYDGVQRNIRYNHVALLPRGTARGGAECALRLDADDAVLIDGADDNDSDRSEDRADEGDAMRKIVIKGISFEAPEQTAQAVETALTEEKQRLDSVTTELERTKAKVDTLTAELDKEKQLRADALDPKKVSAAVAARVALERSATKVLEGALRTDSISDTDLEAALRLDGLSDREIQEKVILSVHKDAKLKDRSADYVAARFDSVVESYKPEHDSTREDGVDKSRRNIDPPQDDDERRDARERRSDKRGKDDDRETGIRTDSDFRKKLGSAWRSDAAKA
jgi:uncharacterized protein